ncbi:MAG: hypothetical protein DMF77_10385 [Acidobacteria bacterium]|nr:MAG: hypothetical protein DMF77_10385 [Acidobacteriota bacterium]
MRQKLQLSLPTLASVAATRGLLGVGAGLLLSDKLARKRRRRMGFALLGLGIATTIPLALRVMGSR